MTCIIPTNETRAARLAQKLASARARANRSRALDMAHVHPDARGRELALRLAEDLDVVARLEDQLAAVIEHAFTPTPEEQRMLGVTIDADGELDWSLGIERARSRVAPREQHVELFGGELRCEMPTYDDDLDDEVQYECDVPLTQIFGGRA